MMHKIKTVRKVGSRNKIEKFTCDSPSLDAILYREKQNKNTVSIEVDGERVFP